MNQASPSRCFLNSSRILLTPSTSPTAAFPELQSTTIGHFNAFGFFAARLFTASTLVGRLSTVGCDETNDSGDAEGRYPEMVRSCSAVGGWSSITSRLNARGCALGFPAGYGPERAPRSSLRAATDGGDDAEWLQVSSVANSEPNTRETHNIDT